VCDTHCIYTDSESRGNPPLCPLLRQRHSPRNVPLIVLMFLGGEMVKPEVMVRALTELPIQPLLDVVVTSLAEALEIAGAGISVSFQGSHMRFVAASTPDVMKMEHAQVVNNEGPAMMATATGKFVGVPSLGEKRFPHFDELAKAHGFGAVFAFPLGRAGECIGALCLYLTSDGELSPDQRATTEAIAKVTTEFLLRASKKLADIMEDQRQRNGGTIDPLTGLPAGQSHRDQVQRGPHPTNATQSVGVVFIDLDRFKLVNDTYGHAVGNELLIVVAQRLAGLVRKGETLTRESGDEFVVFCDRTSHDDVLHLAERIKRAFAYPFVLTNNVVSIQASVGVAFSAPGEWFEDGLFARADEAMYRVKRLGGNDFQMYDANVNDIERDADQLASDLASAIQDERLKLVYQPIVRSDTGIIVGVEALIRWTHLTRGPIPAKTTIFLAEQRGLMQTIGLWALAEACKAHVLFRAVNPEAELKMSVNVSAVQLMDHDFPDLVGQTLAHTGMNPTDLILEVTEGTLFNDGETAKSALGALMARGVLVALDDFGTGFSSMTHLREFMVSQIKIDRSFVQAAPTDAVAKAVLFSLASLGRTLGISIVAEGVETEEQKKIVREAGCELTQGFVYHKPKSAKALLTLMK